MKKTARSEEIDASPLSDIAGSSKIAEIAQKIAPKKPKAADIPPPLQSAEESAENLRSKIEARAGRTSYVPSNLPSGAAMVQIMREGILQREVLTPDDIARLKKEHGWFLPITYASDWLTAHIDFDKDRGRPYVKNFLAHANDLIEVKMIRRLTWISVGLAILSVVSISVTLSIAKDVKSSIDAQSASVRSSMASVLSQYVAKLDAAKAAPQPSETSKMSDVSSVEDAPAPPVEMRRTVTSPSDGRLVR